MFSVRVSAVIVLCAFAVVACSQDPELAKREHLANGDRFAAEGKYAEAIIEYRQAISFDERFGEARQKLAEAYFRTRQPARALREILRAADLLDDDATNLKAGQLLLVTGSYEDAKTRADKVLARSPRNVEALVLRGSALAGLREVDAGLTEIEAAIKEEPGRAGSYFARGAMLETKGDLQAAEKSFLEGVTAEPSSVMAHMALANFYWRTGRADDANGSLQSALKLEPQNPLTNRFAAAFFISTGRLAEAEAPLKFLAESFNGVDQRLMLADYYLQTKRRNEATAILQQLTTERTGFVPARLRLAALAVADKDRATADRLVQEALNEHPKDAEALVARARLRLDDRKGDDALIDARAAVAADGRSASAHFMLGKVLAFQRETAAAEAAYQEALRVSPNHVGATVELARMKMALGKAEEAVQLAESALKLSPQHPDALLLLVRGQIRLDRIDAADKTLRSLAAEYPDAPAVNVELGRIQLARKDNVRARQSFERALAINRGYLPALSLMSALDIYEKRTPDARARVTKALEQAPTNGDLHLIVGRVHRAAGDAAAAEASFKRAIEFTPNNLQAYGALAGLYAAQRRLPDATREVERIVEKRPNDVGARTILGMLLEAQDRTSEARQHYLEALEANPRAAVAANNLAWMYADRGESLDLALQLARTAKAELPDVHEVSDTLGWVYYKNNLPAMAVEPFREAVAKDPDNAAYHLHLGLAYAKTGEPAKAREAVERAIQLDPKVTGLDEARAALEAVGQRLSR